MRNRRGGCLKVSFQELIQAAVGDGDVTKTAGGRCYDALSKRPTLYPVPCGLDNLRYDAQRHSAVEGLYVAKLFSEYARSPDVFIKVHGVERAGDLLVCISWFIENFNVVEKKTCKVCKQLDRSNEILSAFSAHPRAHDSKMVS